MILDKKRNLCLAAALLCTLMLTGCVSKVKLSSGRYREDAEALTAVVKAEDVPLLNKFTALRSADLSGSDCYEEILAWSREHPETAVRYTVTLPTGESVDNTADALDLSSLGREDVLAGARLLQYLPSLSSVNLGDELTAEEFAGICRSNPGISVAGTLSIGGRTLDMDAETLDLSGISSEDAQLYIKLLPGMPNLETIELGDDGSSQISWEDIAAIQTAAPGADVNYAFSLYGKSFTLDSTSMILSHKPMDDKGALVRRVLACMPKLTYLDMDLCGVEDLDMAAIRDAYPNVKVVWRIWFGKGYSVRTDVEKILASNPDAAGELNSENTSGLKYCTDVKYLDIGHNVELEDISFVSCMPKLQVAIISMVRVVDISPLADCKQLEYLELGVSGVTDLSPLSGLKELRHLSLPSCPCLYDISPLYGLTELKRLWIGPYTPISQDQVDKMQQCAPNCYINMYSQVNGSYSDGKPGWRYIGRDEKGHAILDPRYEQLWYEFDYGNVPYCYAYYANDPLFFSSSEP